ncbi:MAG TPA: TolC family outer membrane protein [Pseudomonadales bacterium]|nr:TolC family outer membrane protein [Pseudomonadales bacterium]
MRFSSLAARLTLAGSLALPLGAAQAADLKEIYNLAVTGDPQLAAAKATYLSKHEVIAQARAGLLPSVVAQARTTDNRSTSPTIDSSFNLITKTQTYNSNNWGASLQQPIFNLASWFRFEQSKSVEMQARDTFAAEQQNLIYRVADAYLNILEAQDRLSAANAARDAVKRQLEQVQQRFDVGLVAVTDVLESTAAFDSSTVNVIEAKGAQSITFETLLRLTGKNFEEVDGLSGDFPVNYPNPRNEDAWVKRAMEGNLTIAAAQEGVKSARRGLEIARSGHLPTVTADVSYGESRSNQQSVFSGKTKSTSASLSLSVPLFSGFGTHAQSVQASYDLEAAQKNLDLSRATVVVNTRTLYSAIDTDVARVQATLRGIESSQSALDATQTGYQVGTRNIVDVLQAQQNLYQSQYQYASARYQYIRDTLKLKQAVGSLSPDDIYNLNKYIVASKAVGKVKPTAAK